jgi:hypothetical protein
MVAFCNLKDIRGHLLSMPVLKTGLSCVKIAAMKMRKLGRWKSHLRIESYVLSMKWETTKRDGMLKLSKSKSVLSRKKLKNP